MGLFTRKRKLIVLAATRHAPALAALTGRDDLEIVEAMTTAGAYKRLGEAALIVIDYADLADGGGLSRDGLQAQIQAAGLVAVSGHDLAADPDRWLGAARAATGKLDSLPPKTVAIANVSGGVGKTTAALHLARYFADQLKLSAVVIEVGLGVSGLHALCDPSLPSFYEIVTQDVAPGKWNGVTLVPMRWDTARLVPAGAQVDRKLRELKAAHVLTVFDVTPAHPFWSLVHNLADEIVALSTARLDALANALSLLEANGTVPARLVLNRQKGFSLADNVATAGLAVALKLPEIKRADHYSGELGRALLPVLYPFCKPSQGAAWSRPGKPQADETHHVLVAQYRHKRAELAGVQAELAQVQAQLTTLGWRETQ